MNIIFKIILAHVPFNVYNKAERTWLTFFGGGILCGGGVEFFHLDILKGYPLIGWLLEGRKFTTFCEETMEKLVVDDI